MEESIPTVTAGGGCSLGLYVVSARHSKECVAFLFLGMEMIRSDLCGAMGSKQNEVGEEVSE
jgi:hypothetical protein